MRNFRVFFLYVLALLTVASGTSSRADGDLWVMERKAIYRSFMKAFPEFFPESPEFRKYMLSHASEFLGGRLPPAPPAREIVAAEALIAQRLQEAIDVRAELQKNPSAKISKTKLERAERAADFYLAWALVLRPAFKNERLSMREQERKFLEGGIFKGIAQRLFPQLALDRKRKARELQVAQYNLWLGDQDPNSMDSMFFYPALGVANLSSKPRTPGEQDLAVRQVTEFLRPMASLKFDKLLQEFEALSRPKMSACAEFLDK